MNEPAFACVKYDGGYSSYYEVLIQQNYLFAEPAESTTLQQKIHALVLCAYGDTVISEILYKIFQSCVQINL
jgi:hypothetical protein